MYTLSKLYKVIYKWVEVKKKKIYAVTIVSRLQWILPTSSIPSQLNTSKDTLKMHF